MIQQASLNENPWCTIGDFNVITSVEEELGEEHYNMGKSMDFIEVIEACGLLDFCFIGHKFTWSNKRGINHRIWKRLDRAMANYSWFVKIPQTTMNHLPSTGSDRCPLLMEMVSTTTDHTRYFRFLNCWVDSPHFLEMLKHVRRKK
ncbi:uncharacterized protein [Solanum lycopersicum]|uniref:uncharacterized protein n=1 Tax=Solanum lycopersicum TaxID=4081 RepID=UPI0002BCA883